MITAIQIILILGILVISVFWYRKLRSPKPGSISILILLAIGIVFITFPELSNRVAHFLGVGRGTDMLFYIGSLIFLFVVLNLYSKIRNLESVVTQLIREKAIEESKAPD